MWRPANSTRCAARRSPPPARRTRASALLAPNGASTVSQAAIYWSVMTITSIGYGDIAATPGNYIEQLAAAVLMLAGALVWGQLIGTFVGIVSTFNPEVNAFRAQIDEVRADRAVERLRELGTG